MSSRSILFFSALFALFTGACSHPYSQVYSFRKNSFVPPPAPKTEIVNPNANANILSGEMGAPQNGAIPGLPGLDGGIPGLSPAPAPAPVPGADAVPGIPGL